MKRKKKLMKGIKTGRINYLFPPKRLALVSTNKVTFIDKLENVTSFKLKLKTEVAEDIVNKIHEIQMNGIH